VSSKSQVVKGIATSAQVFREHVWPIWTDHLQATEIHSVEGRSDELSRRFDAFGIDGFFVKTMTGATIPVASRVEFKNHEPRFTLRYRFWDHRLGKENDECEFKRKVMALADSDSRRYLPLYTIQSVFVAGRVQYSLLVETEALVVFARDNEDDIKIDGFPDRYMVIPVTILRKAGISVWSRP
jgi:hypothetical protein